VWGQGAEGTLARKRGIGRGLQEVTWGRLQLLASHLKLEYQKIVSTAQKTHFASITLSQ
jgi:hypothetical protein